MQIRQACKPSDQHNIYTQKVISGTVTPTPAGGMLIPSGHQINSMPSGALLRLTSAAASHNAARSREFWAVLVPIEAGCTGRRS